MEAGILTFWLSASLDDQDLVKDSFQGRVSARVNLDKLVSAHVQCARIKRDIMYNLERFLHNFYSFLYTSHSLDAPSTEQDNNNTDLVFFLLCQEFSLAAILEHGDRHIFCFIGSV